MLHDIRVVAPGNVELTYSAGPGTYCVVERRALREGADFHPVAIRSPADGHGVITVPMDSVTSTLFRLRAVAASRPLDADGDGIDDLTESRLGLDPLNPADAFRDSDGDAFSEVEEVRRGWNPGDPAIPSPVQLSRLPLRGGTPAVRASGPWLSAGGAQGVPNAERPARIQPEVTVNRRGVTAYIGEVPDADGTPRPQIFVSRRLPNGSWAQAKVMTDAQSRETLKLGPGLQINDEGTILVRRYYQAAGPFGGTPTTALEKWNGRVIDGEPAGTFETIVMSDLAFSANFTLIDHHCALNNHGSVVFFASGRSGRFLVANRNEASAPLSATTPETPISLSDQDTFVIRVGDRTGSILLFELHRMNAYWQLPASASGFSSLGRAPGISPDGRILAFYGDYQGATNQAIGTVGPGIFALVSPVPLLARSIGRAKLVRLAGLAENGRWDPGETWRDSNGNGVVDPGEDLGVISGFDPDQAIGVSDSGIVAFAAATPGSAAMGTPVAACCDGQPSAPNPLSPGVAILKLHNPPSPWVGPPRVIATPEAPAYEALLHQPLAGTSPTFLAYSAAARLSDLVMPVVVRLDVVELGVDMNRDGTVAFSGLRAGPRVDGHVPDLTADEAGKRFAFWTNSNRDQTRDDEDQEFEPVNGQTDARIPGIDSAKDLEDFARLEVAIDAALAAEVASGALALGVGWAPDTKNPPEIHLWPNRSPGGGREYLTDLAVAVQEFRTPGLFPDPSLAPARSVTWLPPELCAPSPGSTAAVIVRLLLEADLPTGDRRATRGQLGCYLLERDGVPRWMGSQVAMEIGPLSAFYEHWTCADTDQKHAPIAPVAEHPERETFEYDADHAGLSLPDEPGSGSYLLFVHGWRLKPWERRVYAESALRRLYHQGYRGRFGFFSWPTEYVDYGEWTSEKLYAGATDPRNYDRSEFAARRAGNGPLHDLLVRLAAIHGVENLYVFAHSMGNVAVSEALRAHPPTPLVAGYIACQSAEVASAYDPAPLASTGPGALVRGLADVYAVNCQGTFAPDHYRFSPPEPILAGSEREVGEPYHAGLHRRLAGGARLVDFFNEKDVALGVWDFNQAAKPSCLDQWPDDPTYFVRFVGEDPQRYRLGYFEKGWLLPARELFWSNLEDRFKILAHIVPARSRAAGAVPTLGGEFDPGLAVNLDGPGFRYGGDPFSHSRAFTGSFAERRRFYYMLLKRFGLEPGVEPPLRE